MAKNWMEEIFIIGKWISVATEVNKVLLMRQYVSLLKMTAFLVAFENWCDLFVNFENVYLPSLLTQHFSECPCNFH